MFAPILCRTIIKLETNDERSRTGSKDMVNYSWKE